MTAVVTESTRERVWQERWAEVTAQTGSPVLTAGSSSARGWKDALRGGFARGELVRLAHGAYVPLDVWHSSARWDREKLCAVAVARTRRVRPPVIAGSTALALHGLPLGRHLPHVELLGRGSGRARPAPRIEAYAAPDRSLRMITALQEEQTSADPTEWGSSTPAPKLLLPVRHRHRVPPDEDPERPTVVVPVVLSDGQVIGRVTVEALAPALALGLKETVPSESLPVLDALAWRGVDSAGVRLGPTPDPPTDVRLPLGSVAPQSAADDVVQAAIAFSPTRSAGRRLGEAWNHASPLAESPGESVSRGMMLQLGFELPELQVTVSDAEGFVARVDFLWRSRGIAGEFDGVGKYDVDAHASSADRHRYLRREQQRELRLQRVCSRVLHWSWAEARDPSRLRRLLDEAGVPRTDRR